MCSARKSKVITKGHECQANLCKETPVERRRDKCKKNCNIMIFLSFIKSVNNVILVPSFFMRSNYAFQVLIKLTESLVLFSTSTRIHAIFVSANIYEICKQRKRKESGDFRTCRLRLRYLTWRRVDRIAIITNHLIGPTLCLFRTCFL